MLATNIADYPVHGHEFLGRTLMILILTNQAVFVTFSVVKIPPLAQPSLY